MPIQYPGNTTLSGIEQNYFLPDTAMAQDRSNKFIDQWGYNGKTDPYILNPNWTTSNEMNPHTNGANRFVPNPIYGGGNSGMGSLFAGQGGVGGSNQFGGSSMADMFNSFSGGGNQQFNQNQPEGYNPYQFIPTFSGLERPSSPIAGLEPEQEFIRQLMMGGLLGEHPGEDLAFDELYGTVAGDYMHPDSNPYMTELINSLGDETSNQLNQGVNNIISKSGINGALGGSRAALMQGQAVGDATRGHNTTVGNILNQNYQNERARQLSSIPMLTSLENAPIDRAGKAYDLASIPQQLKQRLIDAQREELLRQQNERLQPLQVGQSILGQRMGQTIPIVSPQQNNLAGAGALFSGIGSMASGFRNLFGNNGQPEQSTMGGVFGGGGGGNGADWFYQGPQGFESGAGAFGGASEFDMSSLVSGMGY